MVGLIERRSLHTHMLRMTLCPVPCCSVLQDSVALSVCLQTNAARGVMPTTADMRSACEHLQDVLLDPIVHAVDAVPPYVGLLRDELPCLRPQQVSALCGIACCGRRA